MLPDCIETIIFDYVNELSVLESLPDILAVRKLVVRSNHALIRICTRLANIPMMVILELFLRDDITIPYLREFVMTAEILIKINSSLIFAMNTEFSCSSVFWLFIRREPNIYHGPYTPLFEDSLLFKLLNLVAMVET